MNEIKNITALELSEIMAGDKAIDLIDVRTPEEFAVVRANGAVSVPLDTVDVAAINAARSAGDDQPIYVICKLGGRSMRACEFLAENGLKNLVNIAGGTEAWVEHGLPTQSGE